MTINVHLAGQQGTEHRQSVTSFSNVSLTGWASRSQVTSSKKKKICTSTAWWAVAKLSLLRKSRNCVGLRGDWQLVTLTRLLVSFKKRKFNVQSHFCLCINYNINILLKSFVVNAINVTETLFVLFLTFLSAN